MPDEGGPVGLAADGRPVLRPVPNEGRLLSDFAQAQRRAWVYPAGESGRFHSYKLGRELKEMHKGVHRQTDR